jgi:hypothetical protein
LKNTPPAVLVDQRQDSGEGHAPQVGGDQHPDPGEAVDDGAGQRGQQQHWGRSQR